MNTFFFYNVIFAGCCIPTCEGCCSSFNLTVRVRNSQTNEDITSNVSTSISYITSDSSSTSVSMSSTASLTTNGDYLISVSAPDYFTTTEKISVTCIDEVCDPCSRTILIALTPFMSGQVVIPMRWRGPPRDLDLHAINWSEAQNTRCYVFYKCPTHS